MVRIDLGQYKPSQEKAVRVRSLTFRARSGIRKHAIGIRHLWWRRVRAPIDGAYWRLWGEGSWVGDRWLTRRSVVAAMPAETRLYVPPRELQKVVRVPKGGRRRRYFLPGDWDLHATPLEDHQRYLFMKDIWQHRDDLTRSKTYEGWFAQAVAGRPKTVKSKGLSLENEELIVSYLNSQLDLFLSIKKEGVRTDLAPDEINVAIGRNGELLKANGGRKRTMAAYILGLDSMPVRIAYIHRDYWQSFRTRHPGQSRKNALVDLLSHFKSCCGARSA